jgi:tetratricopeptide (TPR) repeat protein
MKNRNLILGNQLLRSGKLEEAVAAYEIAIASHPSFPWSHYQLGQALEKLERWEDALVAYQKAIELNPISEVFRNNLKGVLAKQNHVSEGETTNTVEKCLEQGKTLTEQAETTEEDLEEVIKCSCEASHELNSNPYDLCYESAQSLHRLGKIDQAILAYQKAIKIGCDLVDEDRIEKAVKACQQIIELNCNSSFCYESLGKLLAENGRLDDAIEMYRTAIKLNPSFHGFHYHLAQALIDKNDYQNAIAELLSCIDKNFQHYPSYDLIGDLLIQQGQKDKLIQLYKQGLLAMRHSSTDYQKIIQKISDLGLDEEKIFNDSYLKNLQVISDFWEPHQPVCKRDEWIIIELLYGSNGAAVSMTGWNLVAAKCLQKLYGYRIAAFFIAWEYDDQMKELLISFGVEKFIISNNDYGLTDRQKYQLEKFSQDANSENFKYLLKDFKCDDLHIGDLVYDVLIRLSAPPMSTPILDQRVMAVLETQCLASNFWKNFLDSCKVKFLITSHANVYIQGSISRLVATTKGIVLGAGCQCVTRYETVDELYDGHFSISEQLFLYFWNHHRHESAAIGRKLLEHTTGITRSDASFVYATKAYNDKKVYTHLEFCEQLNLDPSLPIVIVASHVFNDAPHGERHRLFVDYYEALVETLKICSQIDSVNWIVKEHPEIGNISMGYNIDKTAKELVNNEYSSYQHIKLAPDDISNISIIDFGHAVITVSGTIAHELACFGIPSILAGSSTYSECGFTNNPQSVDEYKSLLYSIHKQDKLCPEKIEKAYVAYAILYHYMRPAQGNLALGWAEPWAAAESLANKIRSNEIGTVEEDPFFKNFMTQIFLKQRHLLRFDELLD